MKLGELVDLLTSLLENGSSNPDDTVIVEAYPHSYDIEDIQIGYESGEHFVSIVAKEGRAW